MKWHTQKIDLFQQYRDYYSERDSQDDALAYSFGGWLYFQDQAFSSFRSVDSWNEVYDNTFGDNQHDDYLP